MLYLIHQANHPELEYYGGQSPIVHLEADLRETIDWAESQELRWAFTSSNAGARYFEDWSDLSRLDEIDWGAVEARDWQQCKHGKQAEFLIEKQFPWSLVSRIGVFGVDVRHKVFRATKNASHRPRIEIKGDWYY